MKDKILVTARRGCGGLGGGLVNRNNIKEIVSEGVTMVCVVQIGNGLCGSDREWFVWFR